MMIKLMQFLDDKAAALTQEQKIHLLEQQFIIYYDTIDNAKAAVQVLLSPEKTAEEQNALIKQEFNAAFLHLLISNLQTNTLTGIIKGAKAIDDNKELLNNSITNPQSLEKLLKKQAAIGRLYLSTLFNIQEETITKEVFADIVKSEVYYTKEEIAAEFGIDKKTFSKWLIAIYGTDKFEGRKKLNILEYKEIFTDLFTAANEGGLNITDNFQIYFDRQMAYLKRDMAEETASDYKTLKENAEKIVPYYDELNVYPYRIADKITKKMG